MEHPKKLLLISNTPWSITVFRRNLIRHLIAKGHSVTCTSAFDEHNPHDMAARDDLAALGVPFIHLSLSRSGMNPLSEIKSLFSFYRVIRDAAPDLVIAYTIKPCTYAPLAALLLGVPVVAIVTGLGYAFIGRSVAAMIARIAMSFALSFARHIWALNTEDEQVLKRCVPFAKNKIHLLNGEGIDTARFAPHARAPNAPFTFLMNARVMGDKGVREYDMAARTLRKKYQDVRFTLIGHIDRDNPSALTRDELDRVLDGNGLTYLGTTNDVPSVLAEADVIVLPSYREGVPVALLEGAAMEKPMIATNVPGNRDVVVDGMNGFLCAPRDVSSLVAACEKMIQMSKEDRAKMGAAARKTVLDRFDERHIFAAYDKMIEKIAG